jgi:predicted metal-dependent hydrolase
MTPKPRRVAFDLSATPVCWIPGDPQTAHTIDVLHLLLPAGERWFVRVFQDALPHLSDEGLRQAVRGFMGQEATHSRAHDGALAHLAALGVDPEPFTRRVDWLFEEALARRSGRFWLHHRVALVAAIEHYTAFLGAWVIERSQGLDRAGADEAMMRLLRWHGAEEVEHRSVAFDAARDLGVGWLHRAYAMLQTTVAITYLWVEGTRFLMRADPGARGIRPTWRAFHAAARAGRLPPLRSLIAEIPRYVHPRYHPSQTGSLARALAVLANP